MLVIQARLNPQLFENSLISAVLSFPTFSPIAQDIVPGASGTAGSGTEHGTADSWHLPPPS